MSGPHAPLTRVEAETRRGLLEVLSYDVRLDLTPHATGDLAAGGAGFGSLTTVRFRSGAGSTFLELRPLAVAALRLDGQPLDPALLVGGRLPLELGEGEHELVAETTMGFRHDGEGLHLSHDPADGRAYVYAMSFMDAAPTWFACFDQPDLKAPVTLHVATPDDWTVAGNAPVSRDDEGRWVLGPTPPLSTYFVTLVAGPWHVVRDEHDGIALGLSARRSLAADLDRDAPDILEVTRQSLDALHGHFGIRYPFGDYHQAFVPEFNAGAMENPGCITFREDYLSTSRLTRSDLARRASTIAHEMAHQWFGNLVTPRWWDDLWLNESFAEYLGNRVAAEATQYGEIRVDDVYARRQWGLEADAGPTTHPIAGNGAADATSALQDFDGISYAKGAAVLRQLAATVGDRVFFDGVVDHLDRHRFGNAAMADLVGSWERAGAGDLTGFVSGWLRSAGPDRLELDRTAGAVVLTPPGADGTPRTAERTHTVDVAVHRDGAWRRQRITAAGGSTPLDLAVGPVRTAGGDPAPVLVDPDGETWALTPVDQPTADGLATLLPVMSDPMLRATTWSSLRTTWQLARLDPRDALALVLAAPPVEDSDDRAGHTLSWVFHRVLPLQPDVPAATARLHEAFRARAALAEPGSTEQTGALRAVIRTATDADLLRGWVAGHDLPTGVELDVELRWRLLARLATLGATGPDELDRALADEPSTRAQVAWTGARASVPTPEAKAWAWDRFSGAADATNYEVEAAGGGFWRLGQEDVTDPYLERYVEDLPGTVGVRAGWSLADGAEAFYPWTCLDPGTLARVDALAADEALDASLRRRLTELADRTRHLLAVRAAFPPVSSR